MIKQLQNIFILLILIILSGCSTFYNIADTRHNNYTQPIHIDRTFDISGRFFIKSKNNNQYGNFAWYKDESQENLAFNTPLGQTIAKITINKDEATLFTQRESYTGSNLDILMMKNLGFSIPVPYLHYWVQGVALPNITINATTQYGFSQVGWQVEYLEWYDNNHPKVIKISKNNTIIKLLIQW
ncbi:MAG: lipoprotein insertase outer membrane protein LolB [Burkholderiales bacterium]|nr:lipoprotein insertase outer membrane protein LolB [Burkholderiales bacterium]